MTEQLTIDPNSTEGLLVNLLRNTSDPVTMRAFLLTAINSYATHMLEKPEGFMDKNSFISEQSWRKCAAEAKEKLAESDI
jgi:hypothetical protein